jgi:hypothetical protein
MKVVSELLSGGQQCEPIIWVLPLIAFDVLTAGTVCEPEVRIVNVFIEVFVSDAEILRWIVTKSTTRTIGSIRTIDHEPIVEVIDITDPVVELDSLLFCTLDSRSASFWSGFIGF